MFQYNNAFLGKLMPENSQFFTVKLKNLQLLKSWKISHIPDVRLMPLNCSISS